MRASMTSETEVARRYSNIRAAAQADGVDAVIVCGNEYTGFEGPVRYVSGFRILHRYAYVLIPVDGDPTIIFPQEAYWVGNHSETWIAGREFVEHAGRWLADEIRKEGWNKVGVYGLDYIMTVRDYQALQETPAELVSWDRQFDLARAVKSNEELALVEQSFRINEAGFWAVLAAYRPGRTQAELMAVAEKVFTERGTSRTTMDMVLAGKNGSASPEFVFPDLSRPIDANDLLLYGLEIAGPGGHWVEFSRPIIAGPPSKATSLALEGYQEYFEAVKGAMRAGATAHDVHMAAAKPFLDRGFSLGHVTGHSIGMTMIEFPRIGEGVDVVLQENMVLSMHPHAITTDRRACLYMQDTWLVTPEGGRPFSEIPIKLFDGSETPG
jgi:Xaa-Pro dipeptidase